MVFANVSLPESFSLPLKFQPGDRLLTSQHQSVCLQWQKAYPEAKLYACPGLQSKSEDVKYDREFSGAEREPPEWGGEVESACLTYERNPFSGKPFFNEVTCLLFCGMGGQVWAERRGGGGGGQASAQSSYGNTLPPRANFPTSKGCMSTCPSNIFIPKRCHFTSYWNTQGGTHDFGG